MAALRQGCRAEARERAQRLANLRPDHPRLADLEVLVMGLGLPAEPPVDPADHLAVVEERLVPVAERRLGKHAPDYLVPQWRALADRLFCAPFDPDRPRLHDSYAALRAEDWHRAYVSVVGEDGWWRQPVLVSRRLLAGEALGDDDEIFPDWCRLCWAFPETARERLAEDTRLGRACRHLLELDPPWAVADLPAWYALACGEEIEPPPELADGPDASLLEDVSVLVAEGVVWNAPDEELLEYRRRLQSRHPALFELYLSLYGG